MQVIKINGSDIQLKTEFGHVIDIDKQVLHEDSYSADHYEKEVTCTMTELAEILQSAKDTIFKVEFKKKVDDKLVLEKLQQLTAADLKKNESLKSLAKTLGEGEACTLIGHFVENDFFMGRTLVIDL